VIASASLLQGQVARIAKFVAEAFGLENDADGPLQFARIIAGIYDRAGGDDSVNT